VYENVHATARGPRVKSTRAMLDKSQLRPLRQLLFGQCYRILNIPLVRAPLLLFPCPPNVKPRRVLPTTAHGVQIGVLSSLNSFNRRDWFAFSPLSYANYRVRFRLSSRRTPDLLFLSKDHFFRLFILFHGVLLLFLSVTLMSIAAVIQYIMLYFGLRPAVLTK